MLLLETGDLSFLASDRRLEERFAPPEAPHRQKKENRCSEVRGGKITTASQHWRTGVEAYSALETEPASDALRRSKPGNSEIGEVKTLGVHCPHPIWLQNLVRFIRLFRDLEACSS